MKYRCLTDLEQIKAYVDNDRPIAFDFETSPNELYRREDKAALDAHKALTRAMRSMYRLHITVILMQNSRTSCGNFSDYRFLKIVIV